MRIDRFLGGAQRGEGCLQIGIIGERLPHQRVERRRAKQGPPIRRQIATWIQVLRLPVAGIGRGRAQRQRSRRVTLSVGRRRLVKIRTDCATRQQRCRDETRDARARSRDAAMKHAGRIHSKPNATCATDGLVKTASHYSRFAAQRLCWVGHTVNISGWLSTVRNHIGNCPQAFCRSNMRPGPKSRSTGRAGASKMPGLAGRLLLFECQNCELISVVIATARSDELACCRRRDTHIMRGTKPENRAQIA